MTDAIADTGAMLLTFRLDGEAFAFPVTRVHEILDPIPVTPVPNAGAFAPEVINVRGVVVPLLDIRHRLLMKPAEASRIIVFEADLSGGPQKLAFRADSVEQVLESSPREIIPLPELGAVWPRRFVKGSLRHEDELIVLLDAQELFEPSHDLAEPAVS
ncbi:chemotaxis protein CheW [Yoonia sediminilitoris]|uniref:Purine-binding chemotaxis protein CheW n=1 Tax=Yoonia sediminilitoris TaxID=1286148 RepID=A0A2T6KKJ2_9RHOB|nr:chemotaxis protein CheW [Yoonia sediminilitoris]PUB16439.1 purine-binding chemotaxis protein CheW [Yoonia sediminilitoris]RCW96788.1 purine-binding chemotaxis protein CheW [Yoonia sediminilitoris]